MPERAVVLLSGGLDSATVLALARAQGLQCHALSIDYGQRHRVELQAAKNIARAIGAESHTVLPLDLRQVGGSALTADIDVPKSRSDDEITAGIPITYVPARNLVFFSLAVGLAEVTESRSIWVGVNAVDYSGYPDCRPEFVRSFESTANRATKAGVEGRGLRMEAPLMDMSKAAIVKRGTELGVDYSMTSSCYDPSEAPDGTVLACGRCDSCILRRRGFEEAGLPDPTRYAS